MPAIDFDMLDEKIEPVPAWRFYATLPDIPGLASDGQVLSFLAQRFSCTHRGIDYEPVPFNAGVRNFPVGYHTEAISATFVENRKFEVWKYLRGWLLTIIDANGNFGAPSKWKRPISVDCLDESGQTINTFSYVNCAPTRPDNHDLDGTQSHYLPSSCSFVTDGEDMPNAGASTSVAAGGSSGVGVAAGSSGTLTNADTPPTPGVRFND